jgi:membrane-bound ClpP family serine protease
MGEWISIILLVLVGLVLIYLELIFVPGTTFVGIIGVIMTGVGIYIAFEEHGDQVGFMFLGGSFVVSVLGLVYSFKANTWDRFALKSDNRGGVNEHYTEGLELEMKGVAISDLKPIGKAEFNFKTYEVTSHGNLIESGEEVRIIRIDRNKIIVDAIN